MWGTASNNASRLKLTYEIDDSTPDVRFISTVPDVTYNVLFFERTNLNEGVHTLKVTYGDQGNISGDHMFWLDYLQYGHTAHNTPSNDLAVSAASGTRLPTPVLVGIIISCVAAQFLATLSAYLFWRRCRRRHRTPPTASSEPGIPSPMSQTHPYHTRGPTSLPLCSEISSTAAPIPDDALPSSSATSLLPHSAASATLAAVPTADDFAVQPAPTRPRLVVMNKHGVYIGRTPSIRKAARATSGMSSIVFAYSDPYKLSASPPRLAVPVSPSIGGASEGWMVGSSSAYSELQPGR